MWPYDPPYYGQVPCEKVCASDAQKIEPAEPAAAYGLISPAANSNRAFGSLFSKETQA
jgi:hypothetical protein